MAIVSGREAQPIVTKHLQYAFTEGTFAVACGHAVEDGHAFVPGVSSKTIAEDLLQELGSVGITAHDFINVGAETLRVGCWVIHHGTDLGEKVGAAVFGELPGVDMQSAVFAVEDVDVRIEAAVWNGMYT